MRPNRFYLFCLSLVLLLGAAILLITIRGTTSSRNPFQKSRIVAAAPVIERRTDRKGRPTKRSNILGCQSKQPLLLCRNHIAAKSDDVVEARVPHWRYRLANETDFVRQPQLRRRHDKCALVGSSYNLMKHEFGDEIDAHDLVIRLNDPPVNGFEKHVGHRPADISIYNFLVARKQGCAKPPRNGSLMVHCSFYPYKKARNVNPDWLANMQADIQCVSDTWKKYGLKTFTMSKYVLSTAQRALTYMNEQAGKKTSATVKASCGMRSITFLLPLCRNLHLYGFGGTHNDEPYKYYLKVSTRDFYKRAPHDFLQETRFIDALASGRLNQSEFFGQSSQEIIGRLIVHR